MSDVAPPHAVGPVATRACLIGFALVAIPVGALCALASESLLSALTRSYLLVGAMVGAASGCLGNYLVANGSLAHTGGPQASTAFLRGVLLDFLLQGVVVVGGILCVRFFLTVKFQEVAAFGVALAGAAVLFRIPGTLLTSRALDRRFRHQQSRTQPPRIHDGSADPN